MTPMKKIYVTMLVCVIILIGILVYFQVDRYMKANSGDYDPVKDLETLKQLQTDGQEPPINTTDIFDETRTEQLTDTAEPEEIPEATLDFTKLWDTNVDICAWIEIAGTPVDYPVLNCPVGDDERYIRTAINGQYYIGGSLFVQERYSNRDFSSPVTFIYGHTMPDETLFGSLQRTYSNEVTFEQCSDIKIYLPDRVEHYTVFAAVPFEMIHVPATYDFSNNYWYESFFNRVRKIRHLSATMNEDRFPSVGDRVLVLSTCLNEDSTQRYLVMAVNRDDIKK